MECQYRVRIEEQNDGKLRYIPQIYVKGTKLNFFLRLFFAEARGRWENLMGSSPYSVYSDAYSATYYWSEEEAMEIINLHKEKMEMEENEKVKKITYKNI